MKYIGVDVTGRESGLPDARHSFSLEQKCRIHAKFARGFSSAAFIGADFGVTGVDVNGLNH